MMAVGLVLIIIAVICLLAHILKPTIPVWLWGIFVLIERGLSYLPK